MSSGRAWNADSTPRTLWNPGSVAKARRRCALSPKIRPALPSGRQYCLFTNGRKVVGPAASRGGGSGRYIGCGPGSEGCGFGHGLGDGRQSIVYLDDRISSIIINSRFSVNAKDRPDPAGRRQKMIKVYDIRSETALGGGGILMSYPPAS